MDPYQEVAEDFIAQVAEAVRLGTRTTRGDFLLQMALVKAQEEIAGLNAGRSLAEIRDTERAEQDR